MKLREKFKRFWTMDVHNHEGFTLVELIIVIAILAILSGVAVAGYSTYIKKANMQADKTMIAEIKNALNLAMYNEPFTDPAIGVLVLSKDGIKLMQGENLVDIPTNSELDKVLSSAFGSNYRTTLKLKFSEWEMASYLNGVSISVATQVKNSSFLSGNRADNLLTDVEMFTNMAKELAMAMNGVSADVTLGSLFSEPLLNKTAEKYGITGPAEGETWDQWGAKPENAATFSNLLVLATAMDSQSMMDAEQGQNPDPDYSPAASTELILAFSTYYAFASTCPEFSTFLDAHMAELNDVDTPAKGSQWYNELVAEAEKETYKNAAGQTFAAYSDDDAAGSDMGAFMAVMASLNKTTKEDVAGDLGNPNLFTEGAVKDVYDQYMDAVNALAGDEDMAEALNLQKGQVAIIFNQGSYVVIDTIG